MPVTAKPPKAVLLTHIKKTDLLFFEKKSRQKKLWLLVCAVFIFSSKRAVFRAFLICTVLFFEKKSKQKKLWLSGIITAPLCKGSCRRKPTEGLFLQPFHHFVVPIPLHRGGEFRTPLGEACKRASHTRKSLYTREPFLIKSRLCRTFSLLSFILSLISKNPPDRRVFVSFFCNIVRIRTPEIV